MNTETLSIKTEREIDVLTARVCGVIDGSNAAKFEEMLQSSIEESDRAVIIDFEELRFISSAGLRVILVTAKTLWNQKTTLVICSLSDHIMKVFTYAGFDRMINFYGSRGEALDALNE